MRCAWFLFLILGACAAAESPECQRGEISGILYCENDRLYIVSNSFQYDLEFADEPLRAQAVRLVGHGVTLTGVLDVSEKVSAEARLTFMPENLYRCLDLSLKRPELSIDVRERKYPQTVPFGQIPKDDLDRSLFWQHDINAPFRGPESDDVVVPRAHLTW